MSGDKLVTATCVVRVDVRVPLEGQSRGIAEAYAVGEVNHELLVGELEADSVTFEPGAFSEWPEPQIDPKTSPYYRGWSTNRRFAWREGTDFPTIPAEGWPQTPLDEMESGPMDVAATMAPYVHPVDGAVYVSRTVLPWMKGRRVELRSREPIDRLPDSLFGKAYNMPVLVILSADGQPDAYIMPMTGPTTRSKLVTVADGVARWEGSDS